MNKTLRKWLQSTDPAQQKRLTRRARTSVGHLKQLATGNRAASADLAGRIETASEGAIPRTSLCAACGKCPYAKAATK